MCAMILENPDHRIGLTCRGTPSSLRRRLDRASQAWVRPDGLIPAHLFGNMWAQEWGNIYDRVADSLGFYLPGPDGYAASGRSLMKRGYLL